ncbi:MAG: hypothetical protein IJC07_05430 [Clostridia bacterium]|nr:hypothetical protein [Clostridia bacterium]
MDYILLKNFLSSYSLPTLLIALGVALCCFLIELIIKAKIPVMLRAQLPFILAVLTYFAYDMIFISKAFTFKETAFIGGVVCGSLAVIFKALINKLKRGDSTTNSAVGLLLEGILEGIIPKSQLGVVVASLEQIFSSDQKSQDQLLEEVELLIREKSIKKITDSDARAIADMIYKAVKGLNE